MKKYKLLKGLGYDNFVEGVIYSEDEDNDTTIHSVKELVKMYPLDWELVENLTEKKEIIGYKLKDKYYNNDTVKEAAIFIEGCQCFGSTSITSRTAIPFDEGYDFQKSINKLKEAGVFDTWFEPVYKPKYILPKINDHKGEASLPDEKYSVNSTVKYGCAILNVKQLEKFLKASEHFVTHGAGNREYISINLSSGVLITMNEIKQIVEYFNNL